jgi:hypothetical protein
MKLHLFINAIVVDDVIKWVMLYIEPVLEKHKVGDVVTVDKKHSDNSNDKDPNKRIIISSNQQL